MSADPNQIIVTKTPSRMCGEPIFRVYHQSFAVMRVEARSAEEAAGYLVDRLRAAIGDAVDPTLREALQSALADARAFLNGERYANPGRDNPTPRRASEDFPWRSRTLALTRRLTFNLPMGGAVEDGLPNPEDATGHGRSRMIVAMDLLDSLIC